MQVPEEEVEKWASLYKDPDTSAMSVATATVTVAASGSSELLPETDCKCCERDAGFWFSWQEGTEFVWPAFTSCQLDEGGAAIH